MKVLIVFAICVAYAAAITEDLTDNIRSKRGILAAPAAISYSSQIIHHTPSIPVIHTPVVKYVAPLPAVKVIQPYPIAKFVAPAFSYTKIAYPSPIVSYHGYGFGHYH